jgi:hypothetical protein
MVEVKEVAVEVVAVKEVEVEEEAVKDQEARQWHHRFHQML